VIISTAKFWLPVPFGIGVAAAQTRRRRAAAAREENLRAATRTGSLQRYVDCLAAGLLGDAGTSSDSSVPACCTLFADLRRGTSDG
jgi:hypothetical protein